MTKNIYAYKIGCNGTVRDTLSEDLQKIRQKGHSIFGINEGENAKSYFPEVVQARIVTIFYE